MLQQVSRPAGLAMRRTKKHFLTTALHSRAYKCRVERLEVRSMLAADVAEVVEDAMSNEEFETFDPTAVEVQPAKQIEPTIIDDSCLMVVNPITTDPTTVDPIDVRVQFGSVADAYIGETFVATSSYARAGELPGPIDNVALTGAPVPREAPVATPAALDPRAAAFADMRMLSAAALTTHGDASESGVPGGGRRRR
jgi:hypothetical protein